MDYSLRYFLICGVQRGLVNIGIGIDMLLVHSSLNMTDPVSHSYETTNKIIDIATSLLTPDIKHLNLQAKSLSLTVLQVAALARK
jgi:hypothetical protein